jgi:hypothetical protein
MPGGWLASIRPKNRKTRALSGQLARSWFTRLSLHIWPNLPGGRPIIKNGIRDFPIMWSPIARAVFDYVILGKEPKPPKEAVPPQDATPAVPEDEHD